MNETTQTGSSEQPPGSASRWPVARVRGAVPYISLAGLFAVFLSWLLPMALVILIGAVTIANFRPHFDGLDLVAILFAGIFALISIAACVYLVFIVRRVRAADRRHKKLMAAAAAGALTDERVRDELLEAMSWCGRGAAPGVDRFAELEAKYGDVLPRIWVITSPRSDAPGRMVEPGRVIGEPTPCVHGPLRGRLGGAGWLSHRRFAVHFAPFFFMSFIVYMALRILQSSPLDWCMVVPAMGCVGILTLFSVQWTMQVHADGITIWKKRAWGGSVLEKIEVDFSRDVVSLREAGDWDPSVRLLARKRRWHVVVQLPERNMVFATAIGRGFALPDTAPWRGITGDVVPEPEAGPKRIVVRMDGAW